MFFLILVILNYCALGILFFGSFYMHHWQKLDKIVYFCYISSSIIFLLYAFVLIDIIFSIQNIIFLLFDMMGVVEMIKKRKESEN